MRCASLRERGSTDSVGFENFFTAIVDPLCAILRDVFCRHDDLRSPTTLYETLHGIFHHQRSERDRRHVIAAILLRLINQDAHSIASVLLIYFTPFCGLHLKSSRSSRIPLIGPREVLCNYEFAFAASSRSPLRDATESIDNN